MRFPPHLTVCVIKTNFPVDCLCSLFLLFTPSRLTWADYLPPASLSIHTGQPVMRRGDAFSLALQNEDGLRGWNCWLYVGGTVRKILFKKDPPLNEDQIFQAPQLMDHEATYWCSDKTTQMRSSPVTIRTSSKQAVLSQILCTAT